MNTFPNSNLGRRRITWKIIGVALVLWATWRASAASFTVTMTGFAFSPKNITINVGDTITWVNQDNVGHDTTSGTNRVPSGVWHSPLLGLGGSFSFTFNVPAGYYGYYCTPHALPPFNMGGSVTVVAPNAPPTVSITSPADGATFTEGDNILIQASAADPDGNVTRVDFFVNGTPLGSAANAPYTATLNNAPVGNYTLTAVAVDNSGASTTSAPINITVGAGNRAPLVVITNPVDGAAFQQGTNVLIQAAASDPDGQVIRVEFLINGVSVATVANPPYEFAITNAAEGNYILVARATDDQGATSSSQPVIFSVFVPTAAPFIRVQPRSQTNVIGSTITFSVEAGGTEPLSYQWQFNGADLPGSNGSSLVLGNAQIGDSGAYTVVITNIVGTVTSSPAFLLITLPLNVPPSVIITSPANGARFPSPANVTLIASAEDTDGSVRSVEFALKRNFGSFTSVGIVTNPPFEFVLNSLTNGNYVVRATATDDRGGTNTAETAFSVLDGPSVTFSRSPTNSALPLGTNITLTVQAISPQAQVTNIAIIEGNSILARSSSTNLVFVWRPLTARTYSLAAVATDDLGQSVTSAPIVLRLFIPESTRPTLAITNSPANFAKLNTSQITLGGSAADNIGLDHVEFQLNDGPVTFASGVSAWALTTNLLGGMNAIRIRSVDLAGIPSLEVTRFLTYVESATLVVRTEGEGTVVPNLNGSSLQVGKMYKLAARPGKDQLFTGWQGVTNGRNAMLTFLMQPGLELTANFAPNPFPAVAGDYAGLFAETNRVQAETTGYLSLRVSRAGSFTGKLSMNTGNYSLRGQFNPAGDAIVPVVRRALSPVVLGLHLDVTNGTDQIHGRATTVVATNVVTADLLAGRNVFNRSGNPAPAPGSHPFVLQEISSLPGQITARGAININAGGMVKILGALDDGRRFAESTFLLRDRSAPFFVSFPASREILAGWLQLAEDTAALSGTVTWIQPGSNGAVKLQAYPLQ